MDTTTMDLNKEPKVHTNGILRIVAGSYEHLLYGYAIDFTSLLNKPTTTTTLSKELAIEPLFAFSAHAGSIKSLSLCTKKNGGWLATGASDETIKLFSLKDFTSLGELYMHQRSITQLRFFKSTHLLSSDEQGSIRITRTKDWETLKVLKGHKTSVTGLAVHPSGKLALSVSQDRILICWNLLLGLKATKLKLPKAPIDIQFNPSGSSFFILYSTLLTIYDTNNPDAPQTTFTAPSLTTFHSGCFLNDQYIVLGTDTSNLLLYPTLPSSSDSNDSCVLTIPTLGHRIKAVTSILNQFLAMASSNGKIQVFQIVSLNSSDEPTLASKFSVQSLCAIDTEARLTCLDMDYYESDSLFLEHEEKEELMLNNETEKALSEKENDS